MKQVLHKQQQLQSSHSFINKLPGWHILYKLEVFLIPPLTCSVFLPKSFLKKQTNKQKDSSTWQSLSIVNYWFHPSASLNCIWDVFKHLPCFFVITDFFNTLPFQVSRYEHFKVKPVKQQVATQERICVPLIYKHWADPKRLFPGKLQYRDVYRVTRTFKNQILKIKYNKNLTLVLWFFIFGR